MLIISSALVFCYAVCNTMLGQVQSLSVPLHACTVSVCLWPQTNPGDAALERAGGSEVGNLQLTVQRQVPFLRSQSYWAVRSHCEKILVTGSFGSLWNDTKSQTHQNFSQVGNFAS